MTKELRIFLGFFLTGLVLIAGSFAFYHISHLGALTTEEVLNPKSFYHVSSSVLHFTFYLGFGVWGMYPVYLIVKMLKK